MIYPFESEADASWFEDYVSATGYEHKGMLVTSRRGRMVDVKFDKSGYPVINEITNYYFRCRETLGYK